jgi:hypothetical protein
VDLFGLRLPTYVDVAFEFDEPLSGLDGIIAEAKSGSQGFNASVSQLRTYRRARPRRAGARYLLWGIVENPPSDAPFTPLHVDALRRAAASGNGDVWAFSCAEQIRDVLNARRAPLRRRVRCRVGRVITLLIRHFVDEVRRLRGTGEFRIGPLRREIVPRPFFAVTTETG